MTNNHLHQSYVDQFTIELNHHWRLGKNILLAWCYRNDGLTVLFAPYYLPIGFMNNQSSIDGSFTNEYHSDGMPIESLFRNLITGSRQLDQASLTSVAKRLSIKPIDISITGWSIQNRLEPVDIDAIACRYSISLITNKAVILIDIDGFSLCNAYEQTVQINSLSYSINSAYEKMLKRGVWIDFARSTTGDGFYVWNRQSGLEANINLYHLMHMILADNAIARSKSDSSYLPSLKTVFHMGDCYEFYQPKGLSQTMHSYIVGDVTIELARLIEQARAGQILVGDFHTKITASGEDQTLVPIDSVRFIESIQPTLKKLCGIELSGDRIEHINCYFTGRKQSDGSFDINMMRLVDKHNKKHFAYNTKINIYREHGDPIYLGIQEHELFPK